jgi:hypothetical protein
MVYEDSEFTTGGNVAGALLVLFQIIMVIAFAAQNSAVQEAAAGTFWIAINVVLAAGAVIGRRRRYKVYAVPLATLPPPPPPPR